MPKAQANIIQDIPIGHANALAEEYQKKRLYQHAEGIYQLILKIQPNNVRALRGLAKSALAVGNVKAALSILNKAAQLAPKNVNILLDLSIALFQSGNAKESIDTSYKAVALDISFSPTYYWLGKVLISECKYEDAILHLEKAKSLQHPSKDILLLIANAKKQLGKFDEAISLLEELEVENKTSNLKLAANARYEIGQIQMLRGNYMEGLENNEERWNNGIVLKREDRQYWKGEQTSSPIVLFCEGSLNDWIQMLRYISLVKQKTNKVIAQCNFYIYDFLKKLDLFDEVISNEKEPPKNALLSSINSLPFFFSSTIDHIPKYDPELITHIKNLVETAPSEKPLIGINWRTNPFDSNTSLELSKFLDFLLPKLEGTDFKLISLQVKPSNEERRMLEQNDIIIDDGIERLTHLAGVVNNAQAIISTDNLIPHLAGLVNKKCYTILTKVPDWRWGISGSTTPWYPSLNLCRQKDTGNWKSAFETINL